MPRRFALATPLLVATALLGALVLLPAVASAQAPDIAPCRNGGFANYLDPATNLAFANPGRCIRFVARGGTLVPLPDLVVTKTCTRTFSGVNCAVTISNTGPGTATIPTGTVLLRDTFSTSSGVISVVFIQGWAGYNVGVSTPCLNVSQCTITLTASFTQTISSGGTVSGQQAIDVTSPGGATYTNTAVVDPANAIVEGNESNNSVTVITPP